MERNWTRKEPIIAAILSFLIPGLGQIYNEDVNRGVTIMVVQVILVVLGVVMLIASPVAGAVLLLGPLLLWIWNISDAVNGAKEINRKIEEEEERKRLIEKKRELETIELNEFIESLRKDYELFKNGILSEEEFIKRKKTTISQLRTKKIDRGFEDFLYAIIPLKKEQILTDQDLKVIKEILQFKL